MMLTGTWSAKFSRRDSRDTFSSKTREVASISLVLVWCQFWCSFLHFGAMSDLPHLPRFLVTYIFVQRSAGGLERIMSPLF